MNFLKKIKLENKTKVQEKCLLKFMHYFFKAKLLQFVDDKFFNVLIDGNFFVCGLLPPICTTIFFCYLVVKSRREANYENFFIVSIKF